MAVKNRRIGEYVVANEPFAGGQYGEVYVARKQNSDEYRALKILHPTGSALELDVITRYRQIVNQYEHLVPILDVGREQSSDTNFFVMPLADDLRGRHPSVAPSKYEPLDLESYCELRAPLPVDELLNIADQVLTGLKFLHRHGLVHCDVRPANILRHQGRWLLGDFSLMLLRRRDAGGAGPPWITPPEGSGDYPGDVYSFGKTMLLMATDCRCPKRDHEDDPLNLFHRGELSMPFKDKRNGEIQTLIEEACQDSPRQRITLHDLHNELCDLISTQIVQIRVGGSVDIHAIRKIAESRGLVIKDIQVHNE